MPECQMSALESSIQQLKMSEEFFNRATACFTEDDSNACPPATDTEAFTAAQQIAHTALSIDWFIAGAFDPAGFNMDFEEHGREVKKTNSVEAARKMLKSSYEKAIKKISDAGEAELMKLMPEGPVMGGCPRITVVGGIVEHTAHHRGALSVYARLQGKTPPMPYM